MYARRLYEKGMFCFEAVYGAILMMNNYMKKRYCKLDVLEKKARYIMAHAYKSIESGEWDRLQGKELTEARRKAGSNGGKASGQKRNSKAQERRKQVKALMDSGITDKAVIAAKLGVSKRTIYNDIKALTEVA